jgi:hypothetical protein
MATNYVEKMLVFVDESSKDERTIYQHYGRAFQGQRADLPSRFVRGTAQYPSSNVSQRVYSRGGKGILGGVTSLVEMDGSGLE